MIDGLEPYPATKDSGVEWLGEVPEHWEVCALRRKLRGSDGIKIGPFGSQLKLEHLSLSGYKVFGQRNVIDQNFTHGEKFVSREKFNELSACALLPNDLVVTMMGTSGRCAVVPDDTAVGIMDSHLLRLRLVTSIDTKFVARLIDEAPYLKEQIAVSGKGSIMHGLNSGMVKALVLALPSWAEQTAIVRFLEHADRRIQRYIWAKEKLIALLEEQKQAIIHQAVTGQIDVRTGRRYPAYKDSGVEWLGQVPAHWKARKLRSLYRWRGSGTTPAADHYFGGTVPWVMSGDLNDGVVAITKRTVTERAVREISALKIYPAHSLVIAMYGATIGRTGLLSIEACTNQACCVLSDPVGDTDSAYIQSVLNTARVHLAQLSFGGGQPNINAEVVHSFRVPVPPLSEQIAIVAYVGEASDGITSVVKRVQQSIDLLREYRTRLIADAVTGKLDVREAASALPEEPRTHSTTSDNVEGNAPAH